MSARARQRQDPAAFANGQAGRASNGSEKRKARLASLLDYLRSRGWEPGQAAGWNPEEVQKNYAILAQAPVRGENAALACVCVELLARHKPDTIRGNLYLVVSAGWLPDTGQKSYDRVQRLLLHLRRSGIVPYEWITDNLRSTVKPASWPSLADFVATAAVAYRKDYWAQLPERVEVIVEKDTLSGKVAPVTREYDVPLHPLRGYNSESFCWKIARSWDRIDKPISVFYCGDHDPSGRDLERDVRTRLTQFSQRPFAWERLAFNRPHFAEFNVTPLAAKKTDKRYRKFVEEFGHDCAEVEAIPASALRALLENAIRSHVPPGAWQKLQEVERVERKQWETFARRFARRQGRSDERVGQKG
jgi:hypothetical protein